MVRDFLGACDAKNKRVSPEVPGRIIERFLDAFEAAKERWPKAGAQVLTVTRIAGRLAALYAELDGRMEVQWIHARFGLRDAQAECQIETFTVGKHCERVDLETP
jgi:hypothetical protein